MKAELIGRPTIVAQHVEVKIRVERDGKSDDFVVTARAPGQYKYVPFLVDVRWAIDRVLTEHEAELRELFAQVWTRNHATPRRLK
jgi:hypothetical protein